MQRNEKPSVGPVRRRLGFAVSALALAVVLVATLPPGGHEVPSSSAWCLICGTMGSADAVLNTFLFVPLGFGLGLLSPFVLLGTIGGAIVSGFVETVQVFIAGRDASLGDMMTNITGATAGALIGRRWRVWLLPHSRDARRLGHVWAVSAVGSFIAAALLLAPALPRSVWHIQWTARLGHFEAYDGRVISASLAGERLLPGPLKESGSALERLRKGQPLVVRFRAGPPPGALAPVLSIYDEAQREVLVLGVRGPDVVMRYRTRAIDLRFDGSEVVAAGALGSVRTGDSVTIGMSWQHPRILLNVNGVVHETGPGLQDAPSLLFYSQPLLGTGSPVATALSLVFVFLPLGFWTSNRTRDLLPAALCAAAMLLVPFVLPLRQMPAQWVAFAGAAVAVGLLTRRMLRTTTMIRRPRTGSQLGSFP